MTPRQLPGRRAVCGRCKRPIVWAVTMAGPNGPGGKAMPLDPLEAADGNTAVRPSGSRLVARVLHKDETHDAQVELLAMPHFATCPGSPEKPNPRLPENVLDLEAARNRRTGART